MMPVNLSARALGVLGVMVRNRSLTSAEKLSEAVLEGQAAILTAMKELEHHGLIERGINRIGGRILAYTRVSESGYEFYFGGLPYLRNRGTVTEADIVKEQPSSLYSDKANTSVLLVKISGQSPEEEENMPYEFYGPTSSGDDVENRIADQRRKTSEWKDQRNPKPAAHTIPRQAWSCAQVADYFISEMSLRWGISHFTIAKSRFTPALAQKRKAFGTDGELECRMIDLFFESLQHEKFSNGTALWGYFVKRYPEFEQLARATMVDPEEEAVAQAVADKSWAWIEEE